MEATVQVHCALFTSDLNSLQEVMSGTGLQYMCTNFNTVLTGNQPG